MYKFLLSLRYLRTRYIALASVISVTLGVATLIIVNSVMAGFQDEMYKRLHGILSDIVVESHSLEGIPDPDHLMDQIGEALGSDVVAMTPNIHVPAMLSFQLRDGWHTRPINLIGVDRETYAGVSDISQYLLHPENQQQLSFALRDGNYDPRIGMAGWFHRRNRVALEKAHEQERLRREALQQAGNRPTTPPSSAQSTDNVPTDNVATENVSIDKDSDQNLARNSVPEDPFAGLSENAEVDVFDPMHEQHTGIVLGIAIGSVRQRDSQGKINDYFLCRPGDDVAVTFPSAGTPPKAINNKFTVVDFYESKMSEYDSSFAFVPLNELQAMRGMGEAATAVQIKLAAGVNLNEARDKLRALFPAHDFRYQIQTWQELQGPLMAAVEMETTLLNILLFLIIAVAGFGILATFFMIVVEKTRDIGILKSLGASCRGVMTIFVSYGLSLGTVGAGVGMVIGLIFVAKINTIAHFLERLMGRELFDPTVYYFQTIPTIVRPLTVTWIVIGAISIAVLASVLPALRAARLHPVEALRYE
jgi:lipoprotein-releasing system permease protein